MTGAGSVGFVTAVEDFLAAMSAAKPSRHTTAGCTELQPGWEAEEGLWLAVDKPSIRRFRLGWQATP